jgi:RimJ/RimL family protein N-acetyltransferase
MIITPQWIAAGTTLLGNTISLEPLEVVHFDELIECARDPRIWQFYRSDYTQPAILRPALELALELRTAGNQYPFVVRHRASGRLIGSTRLMDLQPAQHVLEIGFTWYVPAYWQTSVNPECKRLLLSHAFEVLGTARVTLQTDELNTRSRKAIEKLGAKYEGVLRSNLLRDNGTRRSSAYYSILADEWSEVKAMLDRRLSLSLTSQP